MTLKRNTDKVIKKGLSLEFYAEGKLEWVIQLKPSSAC
jgi:hypothetical protein